MTRDPNGSPYEYIKEIKYDHYEQPTYIEYGNGSKMDYTYTADLRRLNNYKLRAADNTYLLDNTYSYDKVGNITALANVQSFSSPTQLGGVYDHGFKYDMLNRLVDADGSFSGNDLFHERNGNDYQAAYGLSLNYNDTHGITGKTQRHEKNETMMNATSYEHVYRYVPGSHKLAVIVTPGIASSQDFTYDANGNMKTIFDDSSVQTFYWDESNRLRVIDNSGMQMHHYIYDGGGERILKSSSYPTIVHENGTPINSGGVVFDSYTTYPSPLIVIKGNGEYTKHYFNGSQRVVSRIGDEGADYFNVPDPFAFKEIQNAQIADLQKIAYKAGRGTVSFKEYKPIESDTVKIQVMEAEPDLHRTQPGFTFYYHPDHLGTGTFITDLAGQPYQFFLNLPFGETMAEQRNTNSPDDYDNRYKFNGKELDVETGLYYYGARYYNPNISVWLSVDPLAEMQPNKTPYHFVSNNPITRVDPMGMLDNPIYDTDGNFLGTDDKGLQGKAIVMNKDNFTQGMSHEEALGRSLGAKGLNEGGLNKLLSHKATLSSRVDWKGYVTFEEAIDHYHNGNGEPLYIDLSKVNFRSSRVAIDDFSNRGTNSLSVNFFMADTHPFNSNILWYPGESNLGNVFGTLRVNLESANGSISLQNYQRYGGGFDRFDFNRADQFIADRLRIGGNPTPYNFYGYGKGTINLTKPNIRTIDNPGMLKSSEVKY